MAYNDRHMTHNSKKVKQLAAPGQPDGLTDTVGGSIAPESKAAVLRAFCHYGWSQSAGVRTVCEAFAESVTVRDAVLEHLHARAA